MRKFLFLLPFFLWTCSEGPTEPKVPLAYNLSLTTNEDTALTFTFEDISSSSSISFIRTPRNGLLTISGDTGTYTPSENWFGTDTFQYIVTNKNGLNSNTGYGQINVTPVNDAPVVPEEAIIVYSIEEGYPTIEIALEGQDIEGDEISFIISENAQYGNINIYNNIANYITNSDNFDTFKYQACDQQLCSPNREVKLNINWDEIMFDVSKMTENDNGDYVYFDSDSTWVLSRDGSSKSNFYSGYGFSPNKLIKVDDGILILGPNEIIKANFSLDGSEQWRYSKEDLWDFKIDSQENIIFSQNTYYSHPPQIGKLDSNGNELFFKKLYYTFYSGNEEITNGTYPTLDIKDSNIYTVFKSYFRSEEKEYQTYPGETSFFMNQDSNTQKYDLWVQHNNFPLRNPYYSRPRIEISNSESLGPDISANDINGTHFIDRSNFNGTNSYLFNPHDENGDEMFQGYDTSQNNGDGGSSTVLNYTWIEKASPEHYVPLLVKIDSDGNTLQSIDLENYYEHVSGGLLKILTFNNSGPIIQLGSGGVIDIFKFSENLNDVEWSMNRDLQKGNGLVKVDENTFLMTEINKLTKVDIDGTIVWTVELYSSSSPFGGEELGINGDIYLDSDNNILVQGYSTHIMKFDINGNKIF